MTEAINAFLVIWVIFTYFMYAIWTLILLFIIAICIRAYLSIRKEASNDNKPL